MNQIIEKKHWKNFSAWWKQGLKFLGIPIQFLQGWIEIYRRGWANLYKEHQQCLPKFLKHPKTKLGPRVSGDLHWSMLIHHCSDSDTGPLKFSTLIGRFEGRNRFLKIICNGRTVSPTVRALTLFPLQKFQVFYSHFPTEALLLHSHECIAAIGTDHICTVTGKLYVHSNIIVSWSIVLLCYAIITLFYES